MSKKQTASKKGKKATPEEIKAQQKAAQQQQRRTKAQELYNELYTALKVYTHDHLRMEQLAKYLFDKIKKNETDYKYISKKTGKLKDLNAKRIKITTTITGMTRQIEKLQEQVKRMGTVFEDKNKNTDYDYLLVIDTIGQMNNVLTNLSSQSLRILPSINKITASISDSCKRYIEALKATVTKHDPKKAAKQKKAMSPQQASKKAAKQKYEQMLNFALRLSTDSKALAKNESANFQACINAIDTVQQAFDAAQEFAKANGITKTVFL